MAVLVSSLVLTSCGGEEKAATTDTVAAPVDTVAAPVVDTTKVDTTMAK